MDRELVTLVHFAATGGAAVVAARVVFTVIVGGDLQGAVNTLSLPRRPWTTRLITLSIQ